MRALIVGCGDTGTRIGLRLRQRGWAVTGLVSRAATGEALHRRGIEPLVADLDAGCPTLPAVDRLFYCAPPPPQGEDDPRLAAVLARLGADPPRRLVYISTSGVYGDCGGDWVDERRQPAPATGRARRRAAAEARLTAWGGPAVILRAPGIYGPGRLPIARVRAGEPVLRDADSPWTNRIHVEDLASCALAAAEHGPAPAIYNAADGRPTRQAVFYRALAQRLGVAMPPEIDRASAERGFSEMRLSFLRESRRLDNRRVLAELGVELRYPGLDEGIAACLAAMGKEKPGRVTAGPVQPC